MASTLRVGIAGLVHDHVWNELKHWQQTGRVRIEAIADPHEPLRQRAARSSASNASSTLPRPC